MEEFARHLLNYIPNSISLQIIRVALNIKKWRVVKNNRTLLKMYTKGKEIDKGLLKNLSEYCVFGSHVGADLFLKSYFGDHGLQALSLKMPKVNDDANEVILICCVKDDLTRIKKLLEFHRSIGIKKMVFVDNMSTDGTREFLMDESVDLYSQDEEYHAGRKSAWIRKIQDLYGYDKWYLIVDSDELFSYVGMEKHSIQELIKYAQKKGIVRVRSMLLDMYPDHDLYSKNQKEEEYDFTRDYRFFDYDSYYEAKDGRGYMVRGGPRKRCFGGNGHSEPLTKYPLIYVSKEDVWDDHRPLAYCKNFQSLNLSVLRHYKFMEGDLDKYRRIADEGNYYNGSANYKMYVAGGKKVSFFYEHSVEFNTSAALNRLAFLDEIDWDLV